MRSFLLLAAALLMTACSQPGEDSPADAALDELPVATTTPPAETLPLEMETAPLLVEAASIELQDKGVLQGATWTSKQCALTTPEDAATLVAAEGGPTRLAGYFIAPDDTSAGAFDVVLVGDVDYRIPARTGWDRTDVAEFFGVPGLANSGFEVDAVLADVQPGDYDVKFVLVRDGTHYFCESGKTLVVD